MRGEEVKVRLSVGVKDKEYLWFPSEACVVL